MYKRTKDSISKLIFCIKISASIFTFFKLIYNTKKFKWQKKRDKRTAVSHKSVLYVFKINGQKVNIYLRTLHGDIDIFYEIFWRKIYLTSKKIFDKDDTLIVDAGANIGIAALFFKLFYNASKIICIEPEKENFLLLKKNVQNFGGFTCINKAVMAVEGYAKNKNSLLSYNNKFFFDEEGSGEIAALTFDTLFSHLAINEVDLLKIDIEGAEEDIFRDNSNFLKVVKNVVIEIHSPVNNNICLDVLKNKGYSIEAAKNGDTVFWATGY